MTIQLERIRVARGDLTKVEADAIVNAANSSLLGGGGVDGAIHRAAGPDLLAECRTIGGCPTGEARITRGYNLPAKYVIHTVGPVFSDSEKDPALLAGCYRNSLALAAKHDVATIAFPAVSCGVYGYPIDRACRIAVDTCLTFLEENMLPETVSFILFSDDYRQTYEAYIASLEN